MQKNKHSRLLLVAALFLSAGISSHAFAQVVAYRGATIIDGNGGRPIENGVIVADGKRISAVGTARRVSIPDGAQVTDVGGKFIVPGLIDGNVHFFPWPSWSYIEFLARYEGRFEEIIEEGAQIALAHGVTTVFDSMGPIYPGINVRDRINRGEVEGPRMFIAGDIVGFRAVFTTVESIKSASKAFQARINAMFELNVGPDLVYMSPERVYEEMAEYATIVDFVKIGVTGDGPPLNSEIGQSNVLRFSPAQLRAMVAAVHDAGKIIQAHQGSAESLHIVVESGFDMTQHCTFTGMSRIYEKTIELMLERDFYCGTQWAPLTEEEQKQLNESSFPGAGELVRHDLENALRLIEAGVPQLMTTDTGTIDPDVRKDWGPLGQGGLGGGASGVGEDHYLNMRAMSQRGMTPMMIIQAASRNVAAAYKKLDEFGTLEEGKMADFVVLDANPLDDIENMRSVATVVKEGQVVDRDALPRNPILTSEEAINPGEVREK
jgi:imidazolonepropionase-like amidohydrolase